jgi:hypothetical protein
MMISPQISSNLRYSAVLQRLDETVTDVRRTQDETQIAVEAVGRHALVQSNSLRLDIQTFSNKIGDNTNELLKICAGLRTGFKRLERHAWRTSKDLSTRNLLAARQNKAKLRSTVETRSLIQQLFQQFAGFSVEVIRYLTSLHSRNMEIYDVVMRLQTNMSMSTLGTTSDDITFTDALNRKRNLPCTYFRHYEVFEAMLKCEFRDIPGLQKVEAGFYLIMNSNAPGLFIIRDDWSYHVLPGANLNMSMLVTLGRETGQRCPRSTCRGSGRLDERSRNLIWQVLFH